MPLDQVRVPPGRPRGTVSRVSRPTLRQLEYAIAVADHGHFGRAAEAAMVSQPGLSAQIRELESRLGVKLFERTTRKVQLTTAGAEIIGRARTLLNDVDDIVRAAGVHDQEMSGVLRIGAIPTMAPYLIPAMVHMLRDQWPAARFELKELRSAEIVANLESGDLDLGLLALPYDCAKLHVEPLGFEPFYLALPTDHRLSRHARVPLEILVDVEMLLLSEGHCLRDHARSVCEIGGSEYQREVHEASLSTLVQMVALGSGVTLLPAAAVAVETRADELGIQAVPFDHPAPGRQLAAAWRDSDPRADWYLEAADPMREATERAVMAASCAAKASRSA